MVCRWSACVFASVAACASAQEYSPVVDDRVEAGELQPPLADFEEKRRGGWEIGAVISAAYDDNIFLSATKPEKDTVFRAAPVVAYTKGDENDGEGGFVKAGYRPTVVVYADHGSENRIDHEALLSAGWRGKLTRLVYQGGFRKLGDATADTGRPTDRIEFRNELRAGWLPREKVILEVAAGNRQSDYADPIYYDSSKTYGEAALRYLYSPKTELGLIYQIGRFKVDGTGPQDIQQVTGNIVWQPREKIRLQLEAGAEHRQFDNGSRTNPVLEGRVEWKPRQGTGVFATAFMREEASAYYAGQNYSARGFSAGISQRLGDKWSARLDGGFERNSYEKVSGGGASGREDEIWFVRPALVRHFGEQSEVSLFYRVSDNKSSDSAFGYDQQVIGVELNHQF